MLSLFCILAILAKRITMKNKGLRALSRGGEWPHNPEVVDLSLAYLPHRLLDFDHQLVSISATEVAASEHPTTVAGSINGSETYLVFADRQLK